VLTGYFAVAVAVQMWSVAREDEVLRQTVHYRYAYGAYLGLAAALVLLAAAGFLRRDEVARFRFPSRLPAVGVAAAVLVALLLPWQHVPGTSLTFPGMYQVPANVVAAALAACAPFAWRAASAGTERIALAGATALFTGAALSSGLFDFVTRAHGTRVSVGAAILLVALALADLRQAGRTVRPSRFALGICLGSSCVITGLFLPWQVSCVPRGSGFGAYSGRCLSANGWTQLGSATAVLLMAAVIAGPAVTAFPGFCVGELAAGAGLLVASSGFALLDGTSGGFDYSAGYGSTTGYAGTALVVALAATRLRRPRIDRRRALIRTAPIAASLAYLVVVVLPWWEVLPQPLQADLRAAPLSWLSIAAALLCLHLIRLWVRQAAPRARGSARLALVPVALLALTAVELIASRGNGITWEGGTAVVLCSLLAMLGWIEHLDGLENLQLPEILRVDRI
jgi:hypothetical protein